jgi:hypothetical protein
MPLIVATLVSLTLMVCAAVAMMPEVVRERRPRLPPAQARPLGQAVWLVRAPGDRWLLDGRSLSSRGLAAALAREPEGTTVHLLPSARLSVNEVAAALRWLRRQRGEGVRLDVGEGLP